MYKLLLAHSWFPRVCCAEEHCHEVPCDLIEHLGNWWTYIDRTFSESQHGFSPDGLCYACIEGYNNFCIFTPIPGVS